MLVARNLQIGQGDAVKRASRDAEELLMARIRAKDLEAFEEFYRTYRTRLARFLFKLVHRPEIVEEVTNDTLMVVWDRADTFKGESKLSTWVFAIAYRTAMNALRRQDEPIEDPLADQRVSPDPTPEDEFGRGRMQVLLAQAISELSAEHQAVVEFTYFHEMGYREIAQIMSCPVDTVKTRMFHARRHLKRRLAGQMSDWL
jgi:RNA polymerase sigma factor (sigma-70 family)